MCEDTAFEGFVLREAAGKYNLLDLTRFDVPYTRPLRMNETGAAIWKQIIKGKTVDEIAEFISMKYEIPKEIAVADTQSFVSGLKQFGVPLSI